MKDDTALPTLSAEMPLHLEELLRRACRDALSGLLNRDTMEREIRRRLEDLAPGAPCALFILDLDNFKQVNDTLGHQAGDQAIRASARMLSGLFRASDIVGRLGGDEFAVFLTGPAITEEMLRRKAAQICDTLQLSVGDNGTVSLTASVGVCLGSGGQTFEALYQSADRALYSAKNTGKHRYCLRTQDQYSDADAAHHPIGAIPLNRLLESMASGVALLEMGPEPRVIYVSPSFCRLAGADPGNYPMPQPLAAIVHPDDLCALEQDLRSGLQENRPVEHTQRIATADNRHWLWCHVRAIRISYDNPQPVMLVTGIDVSRYKESEHRLEESNRRLRLAFDQVSQKMWEVDLASRTFRLYGTGRRDPSANFDFPEGMIEAELVHPASAEAFRAFARGLYTGQERGGGNFLLRLHPVDDYRWISLSYQLLCDESGRASWAVGVAEPMAGAGRQTAAGTPSMPAALLADLAAELRLNLTRDAVEKLWEEGKDRTAVCAGTTATQLLHEKRAGLRRDSQANGVDDFSACFSPARMRAAYETGRCWLVASYRRTDAGGNIRCAREILHLSRDAGSGDILAHGIVLQLHLPPAWEHWLDRTDGGIDPLTRLHDRDTVAAAARHFAESGVGVYAVAAFQVLGLTAHPDDPEPVLRTRQGIAAALQAALGGGCLPAAYAPDQILVLFPAPLTREVLRHRLEEAFSFLRMTVRDGVSLSALRFIAGVAVRRDTGESYESLVDRALGMSGLCWNAPMDMVAFARDGEPTTWMAPGSGATDRLLPADAGAEHPLTEAEKDIVLRCVTAMLAADSLESSMNGALQTLGSYCEADRVYILSPAQDGRVVTMPYEWTGPGKTGIRQVVSGLPRSQFPLLERCLDRQAPVFLTRNDRVDGDGLRHATWQFAAFPLVQADQVESVLCIENARRNRPGAALIKALAPHLLHEPVRFRRSGGMAGNVGRLMGMPDLRAFLSAVATLDAAHYTALGAVCLDIPGIAAINGSHGFAYGSRLLWYVCQAMTDVFGPSLLFRTWEAEFVAFLPNTTRQVFAGRCGRLHAMLQRRYPHDVRMGQAWAEKSFTGRQLVEVARRNMSTERVAIPSGLSDLQEPTRPQAALSDGVRAVVGFQPQIELATGRLTGAEALVRGLDRNGRLVPPDQFLPVLEAQGAVRDLDLYVLDRAFDQVERWRAAGLGVVPVSVNLSAVTLRSPSLLASVLAIQSRYPEIPAGTIGLELAEQAELPALDGGLIDQLRSFGLRIVLDNFGARYANLSVFTGVTFDAVKLDRSRVAGMAAHPVDRRFAQDIFALCRRHGIDCLAEGVETPEQVRLLGEAGCASAQGFYYNPPLSAARFEQTYLRREPPAPDTPSARRKQE